VLPWNKIEPPPFPPPSRLEESFLTFIDPVDYYPCAKGWAFFPPFEPSRPIPPFWCRGLRKWYFPPPFSPRKRIATSQTFSLSSSPILRPLILCPPDYCVFLRSGNVSITQSGNLLGPPPSSFAPQERLFPFF